jgi:N6-adenosine-specific RNA methylase IME4
VGSLVRHAPGALLMVEKARAMLATCRRVDEAKDIRDQASAIERYLREQKAAAGAVLDAGEIKLRAERRAGELIPTQIRPSEKGRPAKASQFTTLQDLGVTRDQSSRWQELARIPPEKFEAFIAERREREGRLVSEDLRREHFGEVRRADRVETLAEIAKGDTTIPGSRRYPIVYADPPWRYEHVETESRAIENQYPTMDLDAIRAMRVADLCTPDAVLFMWATSPKLAEAMAVLDAWGFTYRTSMVWVKDKIGMGYYARQRHELLLIATLGNPPTPAPAQRPDSVVEAPRGAHSAKPGIFAELIERMYPALPKIELFCRVPREGWSAWGNEAAA